MSPVIKPVGGVAVLLEVCDSVKSEEICGPRPDDSIDASYDSLRVSMSNDVCAV